MVKPKESVSHLKPYINGNHSFELIKNHKKILKLDSNEATISPSPKVIGALMQYLQEGPLNWYPDIASTELCEQLESYTQIPKEFLLTFNGSDHALETITRTFLTVDDEVITIQPTYDHFRVYAQSCDATIITVDEDINLSLHEHIEQVFSKQSKMVYVVNPNNPTGHIFSRDEIEKALQIYSDLVFIVDEAYYEFCEQTVSDLVIDYQNLIVTRSFSKAFGLAGLRCGYLIADPEINLQIAKIRVGKNINAVAQIAATAALQDLDYMRRYVDEVKEAKLWILNELNQKNIKTKDTSANFILINVASPTKILNFLESHNIYIRDRSNMPQLQGYIRLTIGDQLSMKRFWKIFEQIPSDWIREEDDNQQKVGS